MVLFRKKYQSLLCLLLLAGLLVRAAIPAGFMPVQDERGMVRIVICTMQGAQTIEIPADQSPLQSPLAPSHGEHDRTSDGSEMDMGLCAYAPVLAQHHPAHDHAIHHIVAHDKDGPITAYTVPPQDGPVGKIWLSRGPPAHKRSLIV